MSLNKQKGNMYPFATHTWNPIRGKCPHNCLYCYMKGLPQGEYRFIEAELKINLGLDNFIFIGSSTDMWVKEAAHLWIEKVLAHCSDYKNRYLFQSKDPTRFRNFHFPTDTILGTTLESNRHYATISKAPPPYYRAELMRNVSYPRMVSIEPIMDFDLDALLPMIVAIRPEFVSIGADSKGNNLPEPSPDKVKWLIIELKPFTEVKIKDNLKRLLN